MRRRAPSAALCPYTTLFRSGRGGEAPVVTAQTGLNLAAGELVAAAEVRGLNAAATSIQAGHGILDASDRPVAMVTMHDVDRKSTRLNSSHVAISYAVFCLKK